MYSCYAINNEVRKCSPVIVIAETVDEALNSFARAFGYIDYIELCEVNGEGVISATKAPVEMLDDAVLQGIQAEINELPCKFEWNFDNGHSAPLPATMWTWPDNATSNTDDGVEPIDLFAFAPETEAEREHGIPKCDIRHNIAAYITKVSPCYVQKLINEVRFWRDVHNISKE